MNTIYNDGGEQEIRTVVLYGHTDNFLYLEAAHKTKVRGKKLLDLCMKGMVLVTSDNATFNAPISFKKESAFVSVKVEAGDTATANIKTYKSGNM